MKNAAIPRLTEWLQTERRQKQWFAEQVGVTRSQVSRWLRQGVVPHPAQRALIERVTDGAVPVGAWTRTEET